MLGIICSVFIAALTVFGNLGTFGATPKGTEPLVCVTVHSTMTEISDFRPGYLYLLVQNKSDSTLFVDSITVAEYPSFLKIRPAYNDATFLSRSDTVLRYPGMTSIPVGSSNIYGIFVETHDQVVPGKHLLMFNVHFRGNLTERQFNGNVPVFYEIKSSAYGESQIMGALQNAVAFLLLPGFIGIIVVGMGFFFCFPEFYKEKFPEWLKGDKFLDPRFWVVAIMVSLLFAWLIYPFLTQFTPYGKRSYLWGYGFIDILLMWTFSAFTGAIFVIFLWLTTCLLTFGQTLIRESRYRHREYRADDSPEMILEKISRAESGKIAWFEILVTTSTKEKGFLIEKDRAGSSELWIIPPIEVIWQPSADQIPDKFNTWINNRMTSLHDIMTLIRDGRDAASEGKGLLGMKWKQTNGFIKKPCRLEKAKISSRENPESPFYSIISE